MAKGSHQCKPRSGSQVSRCPRTAPYPAEPHPLTQVEANLDHTGKSSHTPENPQEPTAQLSDDDDKIYKEHKDKTVEFKAAAER